MSSIAAGRGSNEYRVEFARLDREERDLESRAENLSQLCSRTIATYNTQKDPLLREGRKLQQNLTQTNNGILSKMRLKEQFLGENSRLAETRSRLYSNVLEHVARKERKGEDLTRLERSVLELDKRHRSPAGREVVKNKIKEYLSLPESKDVPQAELMGPYLESKYKPNITRTKKLRERIAQLGEVIERLKLECRETKSKLLEVRTSIHELKRGTVRVLGEKFGDEFGSLVDVFQESVHFPTSDTLHERIIKEVVQKKKEEIHKKRDLLVEFQRKQQARTDVQAAILDDEHGL